MRANKLLYVYGHSKKTSRNFSILTIARKSFMNLKLPWSKPFRGFFVADLF